MYNNSEFIVSQVKLMRITVSSLEYCQKRKTKNFIAFADFSAVSPIVRALSSERGRVRLKLRVA